MTSRIMFSYETIKGTSDTWVILIDGDLIGLKRQRDYGRGPGRYLWSAYEVDEHGDDWEIIRNVGSFHHGARVPSGPLANTALDMLRQAIMEECYE